MRRFVLFWTLLAVVGWAAGTAVDLAGFRRLDWTFEAFCAALLVPAAQAAAVCLLVPRPGAIDLGMAWRSVSSPWAARILFAADAALIGAGFAVGPGSPWSAGRPSAALAAAIALQVGAAGLVVLFLAGREGTARERAILAGAGVAALAAAAAASTSLVRRTAVLLLPRAPDIVRLLVFGVGGFAAGVALLLGAASVLLRRHPAAGRALEASSAAALAAGTIAALNFFRFPRVPPPWNGVIRALALAGAGVALASVAAALRPGREASPEEGR